MLGDLAELAPSIPHRSIRIFNEDFRETILGKNSIGSVLTSPPYLNRLDYVISHLAPLTLLCDILDFDLDDLRKRMIGTTKIVHKGEPSEVWGTTCLGTLERIAQHPSKASSSYYYWTYFKYFEDAFRMLTNLKTFSVSGANGALVVQNSYYKELVIDLPKILVEMANSTGIEARVKRSEVVRTHMGSLSPHQIRYVPTKVLEECVIGLSF
jgi:hypothetical protein